MEEIKNAITLILNYIGEDTTREGLKLTPERVLESYQNIFSGYKQPKPEISSNRLGNAEENDMILFEAMDFFSTCEHHFIPFFGKVKIAYIPNQHAIGFDTVLKLVNYTTRKLQLQEKIAQKIANFLQESELKPKGVFVQIEAQHFCVLAKNGNASKPITVKNIVTTGEFKEKINLEKLNILL